MAREWSTEETDAVLDQIDNLYEGLEYDPGNFHVSGELWSANGRPEALRSVHP